jgi:hypothetical protein
VQRTEKPQEEIAGKIRRSQFRFGIGEWYGRSFTSLAEGERRHFAELQFSKGAIPPNCPFLSSTEKAVLCFKKGGVCSLRLYERAENGLVSTASGGSTLRTTCPARFEQDGTIHKWIGEVLLGTSDAVAIGQINFLERVPLMGSPVDETPKADASEEVGRIDNVLVVPSTDPLQWCAVEIQAVYFSGDNMEMDFKSILGHSGNDLPFPAGKRRLDYRSSGPKRLMPQLQTKVPTLRRWGKKMAVVVDADFFHEMGRMEPVQDVSNCDVAWFVVAYKDAGEGSLTLERKQVFLTTLEHSVDGLVAARPVTKVRFEQKILSKLDAINS